jgi:hypothetical protein
MAKERSKTLILLHFDSSPSERRNQFALLKHQLFVDPKKNERTGEMTVEPNKVNNQVKHIATALMVLKQRELPQKEVFRSFLESTRPCKLREEERNKLCKAFDLDDQEAQLFDQFETPPRKTAPQTSEGEVLQSAGAKSSEKSKVRAGNKSESDSSDSGEEKKQSFKGEVTVPTKMERARSLLAELKTMVKEPDLVTEAKAVEDEVKRLSASLAKLNSHEWIAIAEHFAYPKASLEEQEKIDLIIKAVDSKLHTCFTARNSRLAVSHLMLCLY